jgi:putative serine protease XkdF
VCLSCACDEPTNDHQDSRHITLLVLQSAADAAGCSVTTAAQNILATLQGQLPEGDEVAKGSAWTELLKAQKEHRYTLMTAWPADKPDVMKAADGHRDFARAEVIEQTAWSWMAKSRRVGLVHREGTEGHGTVVESYIYRGPDWSITAVDGSDQLIKAGDWLVGTIWDQLAWDLVLKGLINGMSPQGRATRVPADPDLEFARS